MFFIPNVKPALTHICKNSVTRISRNTRSDFPKYTVNAIQDGKDIRLDTNYVVLATDAPSARSLLLELQSSTPNLQIDFSSLISIQNRR